MSALFHNKSKGSRDIASDKISNAGVKTPATKHTPKTTVPYKVEPAMLPAASRHMNDSSSTTRYVNANPLSASKAKRTNEITISVIVCDRAAPATEL